MRGPYKRVGMQKVEYDCFDMWSRLVSFVYDSCNCQGCAVVKNSPVRGYSSADRAFYMVIFHL